jgi:hypothetical protein
LIAEPSSKTDPRPPGILAKKAGYKRGSKAERQCPELWKALLDKHREYKEEERRIERELIASALNEEPALVMKEIVRRLGYRSTQTFRARFRRSIASSEKSALRKRKAA